MGYDAKSEWQKLLLAKEMAYPAEYVIRIFKGSYPRLNLDKDSFKGKKICDIGCGDGRNIVLLSQCGFNVYGMEITEDIANKVNLALGKLNVESEVRAGTNDRIPFEDSFFDYILSWNSCYYMGQEDDFGRYVDEFARVLKPGGYCIMSIPKKTCFIYQNSETLKPGYQVIKDDPFKLRNGAVLRMFESEQEIQDAFSKRFQDFVFASIEDDCFGYNYHWHLAVCRKR